MRILLVEDEPDLASALSAALTRRDCLVDHVETLADGEEALASGVHTLVLLDRRLPDGDGVSLIPAIRRSPSAPPIILLTALDDVRDRVTGLDAGADDYVAKPFELDELLARMRAVLRRPPPQAERTITVARATLDLDARTVQIGGEPLTLPRRELLAFELLMRRAGRVVTREALEAVVYGQDDFVGPSAIEPHLSRLRRRLEEREAGLEIHGVRGVGYMLRVSA